MQSEPGKPRQSPGALGAGMSRAPSRAVANTSRATSCRSPASAQRRPAYPTRTRGPGRAAPVAGAGVGDLRETPSLPCRPPPCRNRASSFDDLLSRSNEVDPMPAAADNLALVKGILDRMLPSGDLRPLLDGL